MGPMTFAMYGRPKLDGQALDWADRQQDAQKQQ